jgi:3-oxoacyl-[acyl-carrier protein] reductase
MMFDLSEKSALITGASGGIGAEVARVLHSAGAKVGISGTRIEPLQALADELGDRSFVLPCNLSDMQAVEELPKQAVEAMGSVDILINNAGITKDNLFMRMSDDDWQSVLDINLTATFKLCKGTIRGMMKARWGRIVNVSSIVGATGNPGQSNYAASKAGMIGMSKSLAYEVSGRGITVNVVAPGFISTAMTDKLNDDQKNSLLEQIPVGRMGEAHEIATAILYLSSHEAAYVTGATLHVNGGMAMI